MLMECGASWWLAFVTYARFQAQVLVSHGIAHGLHLERSAKEASTEDVPLKCAMRNCSGAQASGL